MRNDRQVSSTQATELVEKGYAILNTKKALLLFIVLDILLSKMERMEMINLPMIKFEKQKQKKSHHTWLTCVQMQNWREKKQKNFHYLALNTH